MLRIINWLAGCLLFALLVACGANNPQLVAVSQDDAGSRIVMNEGDTLEVALPANPSTGYTWELAPEGSTLLRQEGEPEFVEESDLVGAPGILTLRFLAVATGEETLLLIYHQPWEEDVAPEETFELAVVVNS